MNQPSKAVLVTGAARRIGRGIALEFAENGYDIALHYHRSAQEAEDTAAAIRALGRQVVLLPQNLEDLHALPALVAKAKEALPHLNTLVNNASIFPRIALIDTTPESLSQAFRLNFEQAFFLTQAFAKQVGSGAVVNILDTAIHTNRTTHFGYLLAKKALHEFTFMAAKELAPAIRVNAVCPGFILPTEGAPHRDPKEYAAGLPLKAQPTVQDVAAAVLYLAENPAMIGQILTLDGGERLNHATQNS